MGPILGAGVYIVVQDRILTANLNLGFINLSLSSLHLLLYGGLLVLIVLFEPKGLLGMCRRLSNLWEKNKMRSLIGKEGI
jgi:ABC-type branched-subunit amino acid transport system permease subunit